MDPLPNKKNKSPSKQKKPPSKKIVDRLTYNPAKHKQRFTRTLRQQLQKKNSPQDPQPPQPSPKIKFGSFNVNGLDTEAAWAIEQLLKQRCFDVSSNKIKITTLTI